MSKIMLLILFSVSLFACKCEEGLASKDCKENAYCKNGKISFYNLNEPIIGIGNDPSKGGIASVVTGSQGNLPSSTGNNKNAVAIEKMKLERMKLERGSLK